MCLLRECAHEQFYFFVVSVFRRTFKDTITFIPVVIILLIPLSPIGHVLVFGAIQRVFPDFFPSCFTERRQNLLGKKEKNFLVLDIFELEFLTSWYRQSELYESTEYSAVTIDETWQVSICLYFECQQATDSKCSLFTFAYNRLSLQY